MNERLFSSQKSIASINSVNLSKLIEKCNNESDVDKKVQLLYRINSILPKQHQLTTPSLITDDYIDTAIYRIQQNIQNDK
jgi:hypothetical protein